MRDRSVSPPSTSPLPPLATSSPLSALPFRDTGPAPWSILVHNRITPGQFPPPEIEGRKKTPRLLTSPYQEQGTQGRGSEWITGL